MAQRRARAEREDPSLDARYAAFIQLRKDEYYDRAAIRAEATAVARTAKAELKTKPNDTKLMFMLADVTSEQGVRGRQQAIKVLDRVIALGGASAVRALQWKGLELFELYRSKFMVLGGISTITDPAALAAIVECLSAGLAGKGGDRRALAKGVLGQVRTELEQARNVVRIQGQLAAGGREEVLKEDLAGYDRAHLLIDKGDALLGEGRHADAQRVYEESLQFFDNEVQAALGVQRIGKAHLLKFQQSSAIKDLEQALTRLRESAATNHYDQQTQLLLGRALMLAGDDAGALKALKAAMRKSCDHYKTIANPEQFEAWMASHPELRRLRASKPFKEFLQKLRASK